MRRFLILTKCLLVCVISLNVWAGTPGKVTDLRLIPSADPAHVTLKWTTPGGLGACGSGLSQQSPAPSCLAIKLAGGLDTDGVYWIDPNGGSADDAFQTYCDMTSDGGGWTLVMKVDGTKTTFGYDSTQWASANPYNPEQPNLDLVETKLASYSTLALDEIRIGLRVAGITKWQRFAYSADSLLSVFASGVYKPLSLGRTAWKNLISGSSLQSYCNKEGFNVSLNGARIRLGILANQETDCSSSESRLGIGGAGNGCSQDNNNSAGNTATCSPDNGNQNIKVFAYIFVRESQVNYSLCSPPADISWEIRMSDTPPGIGTGTVTIDNAAEFSRGGGPFVDLTSLPGSASVKMSAPARPSLANRITKFTAPSLAGAGVTVTDGTYLYARRWGSYPGPTAFVKVGTGHGGSIAGQNLGTVGPSLPDSLSAAFHQGFIYYPIGGNAYILRRIDPATGVAVDIPVPDGLLTRENGLITGGSSLITSNGLFLFSLSYGINGSSDNGWRIRTYLLSNESFGLVDDLTISTPSYYTDGVMADGAMIFPYEWTSGSTARMRRIRLSDGVTEEEWILPQGTNSEYPINGQYDPVHNEFWLGDLYTGTFYRFPGANLYPQASYFTEVFDRGANCTVDNVAWTVSEQDGAEAAVSVRTSVDGDTWTPWVGPLADSAGTAPNVAEGRYVQLKAELSTYGGAGPTLHSLTFSTTGNGYETATPIPNDLESTLPGQVNEMSFYNLQNDGDYHFVVRAIQSGAGAGEFPVSNVVTRPGSPWTAQWLLPEVGQPIVPGDILSVSAEGGCGFASASFFVDGELQETVESTDEFGDSSSFDPRDYRWKRPLWIAAGSTAVNDTMTIGFPWDDTDSTLAGMVHEDWKDLRLGYGSGEVVELHRIKVADRNEGLFRVPVSVPAGGVDGDTALYLGHFFDGAESGLLDPAPSDPNQVYLLADDFDSLSLAKWSVVDGPWAIAQVDGRWAVVRGPTAEGLPTNVDSWRLQAAVGSLTDFEIAALIRYPSGFTYAHPGVYFRSPSELNYELAYFRQAPNELQGGWVTNDVFTFGNKTGVTAPANTWFHQRVSVRGNTWNAWVDGQLALSGQATHFVNGTVGLWNTAAYGLTEASPAFDDVTLRKLVPSDAGLWMGPILPQSAKNWGVKRHARHVLSWAGGGSGNHQLSVVLTDRCGRTTTLEQTVTVGDPAVQSPVILSPLDGAALSVSTVDVVGTAAPGGTTTLRVDGVEIATVASEAARTLNIDVTKGLPALSGTKIDGDWVRLDDLPETFLTNVALNKPTVASHTYSTSYVAAEAVDGKADPGTFQDYYWLAPDNVKGATLTVDLGQTYAITTIRCLNTRNAQYYDRGTKDYRIGVSTDGSLFTIIKTGAMTQNDITTWYTTAFAQPALARYVRFFADTHWGAGAGLAEIEVYGGTQGAIGTVETPWLSTPDAYFTAADATVESNDGTISLQYAFTPGQWAPLADLVGKTTPSGAVKLRAVMSRTVVVANPGIQSFTLHWMGQGGVVDHGEGAAGFRFADVPLTDGEHILDVLNSGTGQPELQLSNAVSVVVDTLPPDAVTDLTALPGTVQGDIRLTWTAPADQGPTGNVETYQLRRSLSPITPLQWKYATVVATGLPKAAGEVEVVVDAALDPTKTYHYALMSVDDFGHSSGLSNPASSVPKDTTAPSVSVTAPANNATVSGTISINANASDNVGVTKVEFSVDSTALFTDTASPYSTTLDTKTITDGTHAIKAVAFDAFGNNTLTAITVTVDNTKPSLSIAPPITPTAGSVLLSYTVSDNLTSTPSLVVTNETSDPPPFLYWTEGAKTATLTVKDNGNNTDSASVNFVIDRTGPTRISDLTLVTGPEDLPTALTFSAPADVLTSVAETKVYQWTAPAPVAGLGTDGDQVVGVVMTVDEVRTRVVGNVAAGSNTVVVDNATGFEPGDEVLIYVAQGVQAGAWATVYLSDVSGNELILEGELLFSLSTDTHVVTVQRIPHFGSLHVLSGGVVTAHPWDGVSGGIVAFRAQKITVDFGGVIAADGLGYRGYPGTANPYQCKKLTAGLAGEGFAGWSQSIAPRPSSSGGGGGANNCGDLNKAGGGGGGHAVSGGVSSAQGCQKAGVGGVAVSESTLAKAYMGGGGGQGGADEDGGSPGFGGSGGGVVLVWTDELVHAGAISSRGAVGGNACNGCGGCGGGGCGMGGGGGGAGGSLWVSAKTLVTMGGTFSVAGGGGGAANGCGTAGGAGAAGRMRVDTLTPNITVAGAYMSSTTPVTARGWTSVSTPVPPPASPGTPVMIPLGPTPPSTGFVLTSVDVVGNVSGLSNVVYVDNTPPNVTILAPTTDAVVHRPMVVVAEIDDNVGAETVELWVDGELVGQVAGDEFVLFDWDVRLLDDGEHELTVIATDAAGLEGNATITVAVAKTPPLPPLVSLPPDGTVTSAVTHAVSGLAEGWTSVEVYANGEPVGESEVTRALLRTVQTEDPMMTKLGVALTPDGTGVQLAGSPPTATNWASASAGAVVVGNSSPQTANDGSTSTCCYWSVNSYCSEQLALLGNIELKNVQLINKIKFLLWNGDGRSYYNYKVLTSADGDNWQVWVDTTGSGINYQGWQEISLPTRPVKFFQVWLSGNTVNCGAHIIEFQAFDGDQPVAGFVETPLLSQPDADYVGFFTAAATGEPEQIRHEFYGKRVYGDYDLSQSNSQTTMQLDGSNDYVNLPTSLFVGRTALTVEGWMRYDSMSQSWSRFVDIGQVNKTFLVSHVGTSATVTFRLDSLSGAKIIEPGVTWVNGKWTHVAAQCGPSGMKLFLDGKLVGTHAHTGCINELPGVPAAYIGRSHWSQDGYTLGSARDVRVSSIERYQADFTPPQFHEVDADTLALWRLTEGSGTQAKDSGSGGLHATYMNDTLWTIGGKTGSWTLPYGKYAAPDTIQITGTSAWGNRFMTSTQPLGREPGLEAYFLVKTPPSNQTQYMMVGWKDNGGGTSYTDMVYAFYFSNGANAIYEDGSHRGNFGNYAYNSWYEVKVVLKPTGGAAYYTRLLGSFNWTLIYDSVYSTEAPLKVYLANYSGDFQVSKFEAQKWGYRPIHELAYTNVDPTTLRLRTWLLRDTPLDPGPVVDALTYGWTDGSTGAGPGMWRVLGVPLAEGSHELTAVAIDSLGESLPSPGVILTVDNGPPLPIVDLVATGQPNGQIALQWSAPTDQPVAQYALYRSASSTINPALMSPFTTVPTPGFVDLPATDGLWYYAVTAADSVGNYSTVSNIVGAPSDRVKPTLTVAFGGGPLLGLGTHSLTATVSEPLSSAVTLWWNASSGGGDQPVVLTQNPGNPLQYLGAVEVTPTTPGGTGTFNWSGTDVVGNTAGNISSGKTFTVDTVPPTATLVLSPTSPVKAGSVAVTLTASENLGAVPQLQWTPQGGEPVLVALSGSAKVYTGTILIDELTPNGTAVFNMDMVDVVGNAGNVITLGGQFMVDTVPPPAPTPVNTVVGTQGMVTVTWVGGAGEGAASYRLYRSADPIITVVGLTPIASGLTTTSKQDTPPGTGIWYYAVTAVDAAKNESAPGVAPPVDVDLTPPGAPVGLSATLIDSNSKVSLQWSAPAGEAVAEYLVYRAVDSFAGSVSGKVPIATLPGSLSYIDVPPTDNLYYYVVTAKDTSGNQSGLSNQVLVAFDHQPPIITIAGAVTGQYYKSGVTPEITINDLTLLSQSITLNGQPYVSGTTILADGVYTLNVTAIDALGLQASKSVMFTIDKVPPVIQLGGFTNGQTYITPVTPTINVIEPFPSTQSIKLNGVNFVSGTPVVGDGVYTLVVTAQDLAGNTANATGLFTIAIAPDPVAWAHALVDTTTGLISLSWAASEEPDAVLYQVVRNGSLLVETTQLQAAAGLAPDVGQTVELAVRVVDNSSNIGLPRAVTVHYVSNTVKSLGLPIPGVGDRLTRGCFDQVEVSLAGAAGQPQPIVSVTWGLSPVSGSTMWSGQWTSTDTLISGGPTPLSGVVYVPLGTPSQAVLDIALTVTPSEGATVEWLWDIPAMVRQPAEPVVGVHLVGGVKKGFENGAVVRIANQCSAPLGMKTASTAGGPGANLSLWTVDGVKISEGGVVDKTPPVFGSDHVVVVEPSEVWESLAVPLMVPVTATAALVAQLDTVVLWYGSGQAGAVSISVSAMRNGVCPAGYTVFHGGPFADIVLGTAGNDCLFGYEGDDVLTGLGGDDLLFGGSGVDHLSGDLGNDLLWGGDGNDDCAGGTGNDTILGGPGDDILAGGGNWDLLDGGPGVDTISGEAGQDVVLTSAGPDVVNGGSGTDMCSGISCETPSISSTPLCCSVGPGLKLEYGSMSASDCGLHWGTLQPESVCEPVCCHMYPKTRAVLAAGTCAARGGITMGPAAGCQTNCVTAVGIPVLDLCNGADDDCNGKADDWFTTVGNACDGADGDLCPLGQITCAANGASSQCTESGPALIEVCNGVDDDCDGWTDEGYGVGGACDGADADGCADGEWVCDASTSMALVFDGVNDYGRIFQLNLSTVKVATVEAWVRFDSFAQYYSRIVDFGAQGKSFLLGHKETTNTLAFHLVVPSGTKAAEAPNALVAGKWHHVAASCGPLGMKLFLDGVLVATNPYTGCFDQLASHENYYIGRSNWAIDGYLKGAISAVRISNSQLYTGKFAPPVLEEGQNVLALYKLDEGEGSVAFDSGPQQKHARLYGPTWGQNTAANMVACDEPSNPGVATADGCGGGDEDCDGVVDEDCVCGPTTCANAATVPCGQVITDACGLDCGVSGTACATGTVCNQNQCKQPGTPDFPAASCLDLLELVSQTTDGVYWIDPDPQDSQQPVQVWCDMQTEGGGWTVFFVDEDQTPWATLRTHLFDDFNIGGTVPMPGIQQTAGFDPTQTKIDFTELAVVYGDVTPQSQLCLQANVYIASATVLPGDKLLVDNTGGQVLVWDDQSDPTVTTWCTEDQGEGDGIGVDGSFCAPYNWPATWTTGSGTPESLCGPNSNADNPLTVRLMVR